MLFVFFFILELLLLFLLSKFLVRSMSRFISVRLLTLIFFPGVVVHELAHLLVAGILFVPVGEMELVPKMKEDGQLRLGSVLIGKTDPVRRMIIGLAPLFVGLLLILGIPYLLGNIPGLYLKIFIVYALFVAGNTMFSSKKDLEGVLEFFILVAVIMGVFYFINFRMPFEIFLGFLEGERIVSFIKEVDVLLLWTIAIDFAFLGIGFFLANVLKRH